MKKILILFLITFSAITFCLTSCDQDSDVSDKPSGTPSTPPVPTLTITPSGNVSMTVDETKDFTITVKNVKLTNVLCDVSGDVDAISYNAADILTGQLTVTAKKTGTVMLTLSLKNKPKIIQTVTITVIEDVPPMLEETILNVTVDVTIDTAAEELIGKTMDDIAAAKLYYGFGIYTEGTELSTKFDIVKDDMTVDKATDTTGTVTFTIKNDALAGNAAPFFYVELTDSNGARLAEMDLENIYQATEIYQKNSTHSITLTADSLYGNLSITLQ